MRGGNPPPVVVYTDAVVAPRRSPGVAGRLPVVAARDTPTSPSTPGVDSLRTLAWSVSTAGFVSGLLVVGFGGRLAMRVLVVQSGSTAQGRADDAGERVGEITFGGSIGFLIFAGLLIPLASSLVFIPLRRILPRPAWISGSLFGLLLLATFGVSDPLSPDNRDFVILSPLWLAVTLVCITALLFGDDVQRPRRPARRHRRPAESAPHRTRRARRKAADALPRLAAARRPARGTSAPSTPPGGRILHGRLVAGHRQLAAARRRIRGRASIGAFVAASAVYAALTDIV